jgi:hypothetical protein
MKRNFELTGADGAKTRNFARIVGDVNKDELPYVSIETDKSDLALLFIPDNQLERFAVNILKAIGSDKLASNRGPVDDTYII